MSNSGIGRKLLKLCLTTLAGLAFAACATTKPEPAQPDSPGNVEAVTAKADWLNALPQSMSDELCDQKSALRGCYPASEQECKSEVQRMTVSCVLSVEAQIPGTLRTADTASWGQKIGICTNDGIFGLTQAATPACQDTLKRL